MTERTQRGLFVAIVAASVLLRGIDLGWAPGINGDEAWYGVQAQDLLAGRAWSSVTPTNNWQNPFFLLPTLVLAALPPSFVLLRASAVGVGVLTIAMAYRLVPRTIGGGAPIARAAALLVATLPIQIGYSRLAWDTCETTLASLVAFFFALEGRWWAMAAAFFALVWIHPLNVFSIVPLAFVALGVLATQPASADRRTGFVRAVSAGLASLLAARWVLLPRAAGIDTSATLDNLLSVPGWWRFAADYAHLLDGVTIYRYVVGEPGASTVMLHDAAFFAVATAALATGLPRMLRARDLRLVALVAGTAAGAGVFHVLLGALPLEPGHERYAMGLVMPALLSLLALLRHAIWPRALVPAIAALMLASFASNYTLPLRTSGSRAHRTFHTAPGEPKALALAAILSDAGPTGAVHIYAEDWWLHWPMRYLASRDERVRFEFDEKGNVDENRVREFAAGGAYLVGFEGGPLQSLLPRLFPDAAPLPTTIRDVAGRPLVHVWHRDNAKEPPGAMPPR